MQRVFSTIPTAYPVGGWKHLTGSDWARYVLIDQRTLIASGHERLMHFFPDYALLESLGVRTLVNIPVVVCRRTVGAFALLLETPTVDQDALAQVEAIALLMSGVFTLGQGASR
ncbi:GAF domain-containing protein [Pandoraea anapnoica]|uniref:GAF domain-containing protein n=1 Tax=Pandoraea anapnoica TaxID=2508301 RepID=UPI00123F88A9|nr:GAF domain-containing protein [Pandoraea anapnoica]